MKVRNGFVSNSSSSSFVVLGIKKNNADEIWAKFKNVEKGSNDFYDVRDDTYEYLSEENIIGKYIASGDECDFSGPDISLAELNKIAEQFIKDFGEEYKDDVRLYSGVDYC